jgi:signal transduction histidine kinase
MGFSKIIKKRMEERILPNTAVADPKVKKAAEQVMNNLDIVVKESERLTALINEVLDLAKIEAGKVEWLQEPVDMAEVMDQAIGATAALFRDKGLRLSKAVEPDLPVITGDKDRLVQVVVNLLSNAQKFTNKGSVHCSVEQTNIHTVKVCVADTGVGINEKDIHAVFEKFKQVGDDTLTDKPQGTGLGLSICKEIIEQHGGRIWVESTLGKGSVFCFTLPTAKSQAP